MLNWIRQLLGGEPIETQPYTVKSKGITPPDVVRGTFVYECLIRCPRRMDTHTVEVTVHDSLTQPFGKCGGCGRKVMLYPAPIKEVRIFDGKEFEFESGRLSRLDIGDGHSVRLGKVYHYEVEGQNDDNKV